MILCDSGPLIAILDVNDAHHKQCSLALDTLPADPMLTTWPCLAEAMYFLGRNCGLSGQERLWMMWERGALLIHGNDISDCRRMRELMNQYADLPMSLADASLVTVAEKLNIQTVFTIDHHFHIYRPIGLDHFTVLP
ncbi:MAG: type II toxin-antitoxin system VapC family toxin [Gemmataceae bacterium]